VLVFRQAPADAPPEKAAVIANDRAFEAAYAKADVKALADFFAEDAEYTSEEGQTFSGRAQIEETLRAGLLARKGGKIAINPETVRALSPDVVSEKGSTTVTGKNGESNTSLYTAIHVKKDGKWKISQWSSRRCRRCRRGNTSRNSPGLSGIGRNQTRRTT
jgi:uncharacterized protein (TIGR02246 family)